MFKKIKNIVTIIIKAMRLVIATADAIEESLEKQAEPDAPEQAQDAPEPEQPRTGSGMVRISVAAAGPVAVHVQADGAADISIIAG